MTMNREEHRAWISLKREVFEQKLKILAHERYVAGFEDGVERNTLAMMRYMHDEFGFGDKRFSRLIELAKKDVQAMLDKRVTVQEFRDGLVAEGCKSLKQLQLKDDPSPDRWRPVTEELPEDENKVLCCTVTKKGLKNLVIGYYSSELKQWCCGMSSNVVAWRILPPVWEEKNEKQTGR